MDYLSTLSEIFPLVVLVFKLPIYGSVLMFIELVPSTIVTSTVILSLEYGILLFAIFVLLRPEFASALLFELLD